MRASSRTRPGARRGTRPLVAAFATALALAAVLAPLAGAAPATGDARPAGLVVALTARGNELAKITGLLADDLPGAYVGGYVTGQPSSLACSVTGTGLTIDGWSKARFATSEGQALTSAVAVFANAAMVGRDWARAVDARTAGCLGRSFAQSEHATLVYARRVTYTPRLDHAALYRILVRRGAEYHAASYYLMGDGHLETSLTVTSSGRSTPRSIEQLAASLLVSRLED